MSRWSPSVCLSIALAMVAACGGSSADKDVASGAAPADSPAAPPHSDPDDPPAGDPPADDPPTDSGTLADTGTTDDTGTPVDTGTPTEDSGEPGIPSYHGKTLDPVVPLPDFEVSDQHGVLHGPDSLVGAPTVVWFFRDTASACTNDACGYRDLQADFDALGVRIVAVGPTSVANNAAWADSLDYEYLIWSDTEGVLAAAYGTESDHDEGNLRHAFVLDASGQAFLWYEGAVSLGADPNQVLEDCEAVFGASE